MRPQALRERRGRERAQPGRRQLDRQRQTVQAGADLRDRGGILRGQGKARVGGLGARGEERDRLVAGNVGQRLVTGGSGSGSGRHREVLLARHAEHGPAGHERLQPRAGAQEVGDVRRGVDDLLEVVQHQEQVFRPQRGGELLRRRPVGEFAQVQGVGDRRDDEVGIADRGEGDEDRAVGEAASNSAATSIARRVLPTPPGPVSVTRRTSGRRSRSRTAATSRSRPTSGVSGRGRVLTRVAGLSDGHDA